MLQEQKLNNIKFSRIHSPKDAEVVPPGTWSSGRISTGVRKFGKYETIGFVVDKNVNIGINKKTKYNLEGFYQQQGKYGWQFIITKMDMLLDTKTPEGMEQALTLIMTDTMAKRIVEHFGTAEAVAEAFENKYSTEFMKIKGMTEDKLSIYYELYVDKIVNFAAITKLMPYGFDAKESVEIYNFCGRDTDKAIEFIKEDIYIFYLKGITSFETVDGIFLNKFQGSRQDTKRVAAYTVYCLKNPISFGDNDSYKTYEQANVDILPRIQQTCGTIDGHLLNNALRYGESRNALIELNGKIGLKIKYDTEMGIYSYVNELNSILKQRIVPLDDLVEEHIQNCPIALSDEQIEAIRLACSNGVTIISGNAGAGKSTILGVITKIFMDKKYSIRQAALSGKAALRIEETTGLPATTIHRMFLENGGDCFNLDNPYMDIKDMCINSNVVIIDEASMIGGAVFFNLLKAIKNSDRMKHVIIVGDNAQLPAIGIGQPFTDLLKYSSLSKAKLTKVYRQASESGTLAAATMIRQNQNFIPVLDTFGNDFKYLNKAGHELLVEFERYMEITDGDILEVQFLAQKRDECVQFNNVIQKRLGIVPNDYKRDSKKSFEIFVGDKVILTKNSYNNLTPEGEEGGKPVFNGNLGIVKSINKKFTVVDFQGIGEVGLEKETMKHLLLGYCITVHKAQGSGFKAVIAYMSNSQSMLSSNMLYTAITRAKHYCTVSAPERVIEDCADRNAHECQTWLQQFYGGKK